MSERSKKEVILLSTITSCVSFLHKEEKEPVYKEFLREVLEESVNLVVSWKHKGFTQKQRKEIRDTLSQWELDIQAMNTIYTVEILSTMQHLIAQDLFNSFEGNHKKTLIKNLLAESKKIKEKDDPEISKFETQEVVDTMVNDLYSRIKFNVSD